MSSSNSIISEQRTERMVVSSSSRMLRTSQFLKPTLSVRTPAERPSKPTSTIFSLAADRQKVTFLGWFDPQKKWMEWVDLMKPNYSLVWRTSGIHDAIMDSGLKIPKNQSLLLWFAEKWSPKTNTFVLPWGEMTVTLEDIMVLGGFSVVGAPATCQADCPEDLVTLDKLKKKYKELVRSPSKKASLSLWMNIFKGTEKAIEHEATEKAIEHEAREKSIEHVAFLVFWLSKYLFASVKDTVLPETFHLAILLARGRKIALAPAVLATLYRDLHFLQDAIVDVKDGVKNDVVKEVFSPMYYVQAWIWERFSDVSPHAVHNVGETRLARWIRLDVGVNVDDLEGGICREDFVWRPYASNTNHFISESIYVEYGEWKNINTEEMESYARCLRACKLVGLDIMQDYSPHRVCRQFGYAQDIPADILQIEDGENAWAEYFTPLTGSVYIPSRGFNGHVSARYEDWWKKVPVSPLNQRVPISPKRRRKRINAI